MTLCYVCQAIPFQILPSFPDESYVRLWSDYPGIHELLLKNGSRPPSPIGFHYQSCLENLRITSTLGCELCRHVEKKADDLLADIASMYAKDKDPRRADPSFDLWITARPEGGDGFWIFTISESTAEKQLFLLAVLGIGSDYDDPLNFVFVGRPINGPPEGKTLDLLAGWVKACDSHDRCLRRDGPMPTRLVDLGALDTETTTFRLVESRDVAVDRYTALRYCWGRPANYVCTSRATLGERKSTITLRQLPKTFQDAIAVTRKLGVRYIWIDSLCIIQDDERDWEHESARMADVYSNAYLTIAATGKSSSSDGLFLGRSARVYFRVPLKEETSYTKGHILLCPLQAGNDFKLEDYISMRSEPLSQRAWAFQERVLSRRVLHFTSTQVFFECLEGSAFEDGLRLSRRYCSVWLNQDFDTAFSSRSSGKGEHPRAHWNQLVRQYSSRKLTFPSDKLPALAGVAEVYSKLLDDQYVCGLWRKSMIEGLYWRSLDMSTAAPEYRAPSWSWASVDGTTALGVATEIQELATVLDCSVQISGDNPFGRVQSGSVTLRAPLIPIFLSKRKGPRGEMYFKTAAGSDRHNCSECRLDTIDERFAASAFWVQRMRLYALVLGVTSKLKAPWYMALNVASTETQASELGPLKRVGSMILFPDFFGPDDLKISCTVTLV
ncbi:hypothetical protein HIM_05795 [Hirsutella minnesotensis 3608]|uniref:Heterokaryon incompatibility domain-containing protein n=1 Tax=Hirsutella minnesotensis 3608 TaxID=1043627 RepID=A0A0F7ZK18_9HYPO|nr:hypothetical protein HIM_05795 [Hirsutella minnesotensis 3608]